MRVLFMLTGKFPVGMAATNRIKAICEGLSALGHEIKVLITIRTESYDKVVNTKTKGNLDGYEYEYVSNSTVKSKSLIIRTLQQCWCYIRMMGFLLREKKNFDLVYIYDSGYYWWPVLLFIKLNRIKVVNEMPEIPFYYPGKRYDFYRALFFRFIYPLFNGGVVISTALYELASRYKSSSSKLIRVPIVIKPASEEEIRTSLKGDPYIIHTGSLSEDKDGIQGIIKAFSLALSRLNQPVNMIITGKVEDSPQKNDIEKLILDLHLQERIKFTGYIGNEELRLLQKDASLAIINKYDSFQNWYCFATKLSEYLDCAIPVIATNVGESAFYLKEGVNAFVVEPGNKEALANKITEALNDRERSKKIGMEGRKLVEKEFNYLYQAKRLESFFQDVLSPAGDPVKVSTINNSKCYDIV